MSTRQIIAALLCCFSSLHAQGFTGNYRWGVINGRLIDMSDDFDHFGSRTGSVLGGIGRPGVGGSNLGGPVFGGVGVSANIGIGVGGMFGSRPGFPGSVHQLGTCPQSRCLSQHRIFPSTCEFRPVLASSLTGSHCLGCPTDICRGTTDLSSGIAGGVENTGRGNRRTQRRMRRIQRQACRHLGICNFGNQNIGGSRGLLGSGGLSGTGLGTGFGAGLGTGLGAGYMGRSVSIV